MLTVVTSIFFLISKTYSKQLPTQVVTLPDQDGKAVTLLLASGPFCTTEDLNAQPLHDFIALALDEKFKRPDAVIFIGPFVDERHPMVRSGNCTLKTGDEEMKMTYDELEYSMMVYIAKLRDAGIHVIIIPSLSDVNTEGVYPQAAFKLREILQEEETQFNQSGLHDASTATAKMVALPNPAMFRINETVIAINGHDILMHLMQNSIVHSAPKPDQKPLPRMVEMTRACLTQRSFYPLFPAVPGASIDHSAVKDGTLLLNVQPDIFISTSKLAPFIKRVHHR